MLSIVIDLYYPDVAFGVRNSQCHCPLARALSRAYPQGVWKVDGHAASNPVYGEFQITREGQDAIAEFDAGEAITARRFVLVGRMAA